MLPEIQIKISDLYVLTNWSVLHLRTNRSFESLSSPAFFLMFWTQAKNQLGLKVKMCSGLFHSTTIMTRSPSLSLRLNPSPTNNWLKFADRVNIVIICTYLQSVCAKSQETWVFWSPLVSVGIASQCSEHNLQINWNWE